MTILSRTEIENQIKLLSDISWLTPSQSSVYHQIGSFLGGIHRVINLYGVQGVGKTFLTHMLCKEGLVEYVASPELIRTSEKALIIDNAQFERTAVRGMRNQMRKHSLKQVVLVSRYRVEDSVPAFCLSITPDDLRCFRANLFRNLDIRLPACSVLNLWEHFKLIGGPHGHRSAA